MCLQDVLLSDKNRCAHFASQSQSCPELHSVPPQRSGGIVNSQLIYSMNGNGRTKGRPKKLAEKRTKKIDARFTEEEYAIVCGLELTLGLNKTDLVRKRLLQDAPLLIVNAKELIALLNEIGTEMGRCGNNINQLAKYANILKKSGASSPMVVERFNTLFEQYLKTQQTLNISLRKVIRMTSN